MEAEFYLKQLLSMFSCKFLQTYYSEVINTCQHKGCLLIGPSGSSNSQLSAAMRTNFGEHNKHHAIESYFLPIDHLLHK